MIGLVQQAAWSVLEMKRVPSVIRNPGLDFVIWVVWFSIEVWLNLQMNIRMMEASSRVAAQKGAWLNDEVSDWVDAGAYPARQKGAQEDIVREGFPN